MRYTTIDPIDLDEKRVKKRKGFEIKGCMSKHLLVFKPNCMTITAREYLCNCDQCLALYFDNCSKNEVEQPQLDSNILSEEINNDCYLDEDDSASLSMKYEFIETPTAVAILSCHTSEPIYLIRIIEKGIAEEKIKDRFGHVIFEGEYYLKGNYLRKGRSKTLSKLQFALIENPVYITPDEVF